MSIKTVTHRPYSADLGPCDVCLFPKLTGCRYETIGEMKEVVTKVIDMLTQEEFHGTFQKVLERYNKCIAAGGDYFEGDYRSMCVLSIKVLIWKKSGNLSYAPRISIVKENRQWSMTYSFFLFINKGMYFGIEWMHKSFKNCRVSITFNCIFIHFQEL